MTDKSIRGLLAGKELIGFKESPTHGNRAAERASSAKVGPVKAPKSAQDDSVLQRASTAKVGIEKRPR